MKSIKLAIIGCGAVTELFYLPALTSSRSFHVDVLVDTNLERAQKLSNRFGQPFVTSDYREIFEKVDAAILALPHFLHAPVTIDIARRGIHVFVEKPMALRVKDCEEMIKTAESARAVLAVGHVRRFYRSSVIVKRLLQSRLLDEIIEFDFREGNINTWDAVSDFNLRSETGGGVLADTGSHVLDLLLWWLGDFDNLEYYDDAMGGAEADCELRLRLQSGVEGFVELSKTRRLRNSFIIKGKRATVEVGAGFNVPVYLKDRNQDFIFTSSINHKAALQETFLDIFQRQLEDFGDAILNNREPLVSGQEGKRAVELIDSCYASRQVLEQPWLLSKESLRGELT
jgi:predicted dehydrogenase